MHHPKHENLVIGKIVEQNVRKPRQAFVSATTRESPVPVWIGDHVVDTIPDVIDENITQAPGSLVVPPRSLTYITVEMGTVMELSTHCAG